MASHSFQVALHGLSGLPEDDYVNVLYFDVGAPDTVEGTADGIHQAYDDNLGSIVGGISGMTIKAYAGAEGQPVLAKDYSFAAGAAALGEAACCLSYAAVDDPDASTARRRGRIYIGPIQVGNLAVRPGTALRGAILDFGEALASIGFASNTTWQLHSKTDGSFHKIESIWTDDAWDTQRRRGLAPTTRTVRDVQ